MENMQNALKIAAPLAPQFHEPLKAAMALSAIDTPLRVAHFLAQCSHESNGFTRLRENMNYSAEGLAKTWPKRYRGPDGLPNLLALRLSRNPQAIAKNVYANRMGNGDYITGDGWKYRGGGIIQLTGRDNWLKYSMIVFGDDRLLTDDTLITDPSACSQLACAFWLDHGLNELADANDIDAISDRINIGHDTEAVGDSVGFADRLDLFNRIYEVIK